MNCSSPLESDGLRGRTVSEDSQSLEARHNYDEYVPAGEVRIAPGARVEDMYRLKIKVRLPARMFYDDKLLVVITD